MIDEPSCAAPVLAIDVGGSTIKAEVVGPGFEPWAQGVTCTPKGQAALHAIIELARNLLASLPPGRRSQIRSVGLAVPGILDLAAGTSVMSVNIGWRDVPVVAQLSDALGMSVSLGHDVSLAGLAEWRLGAARDTNDVVIVVVGTGISAAIISAGQLVQGGAGQAGELGHMVVRPGGPLCSCGARGCLEAVASATAIARAYASRRRCSIDGSRDVVRRLPHDPTARQVWAEAISALADGITNAMLLLAPTRVVIGGGLANAGKDLIDPLVDALRERAHVAAVPPVVLSELGTRAGVIGAALTARARPAATGAHRACGHMA